MKTFTKEPAVVTAQMVKSQNITFILNNETQEYKATLREYGKIVNLEWTHERCLREIEERKEKLKVVLQVKIGDNFFLVEKKLSELGE
jgi:hypothetical protein